MSVKKYYSLAKQKLFPICRSITGNGVRKSLKILKQICPSLAIIEIPSGKKVFDGTTQDFQALNSNKNFNEIFMELVNE